VKSVAIGVDCNRSHHLRSLLDGHRGQYEFVSSNLSSWRKRHAADLL
jgi:hypothetical protein